MSPTPEAAPAADPIAWEAPRAWWIAAAAVLALGLAHAALYLRVTHDDAYVFCRYAENFAAGHGLVFNAGERADAYTSFLWVTLLSLGTKFGFDPVALSKGMGLAFHLASQVALLCLVREIPFASRWLALAAPLLLASSAAFALETVAGLETQLFVFLLLATAHVALRATRTGRGDLTWPGLCALLALARPDGVLFFPLFLVWRGLGRDRLVEPRLSLPRSVVAPALVYLFLVGGWWIARFAYYGHALPNPFYVKGPLAPAELAAQGAYRALAFLDENGGFLFGGLVALALVGWRSEPWKAFAFFAIAGRLFLQIWSGGPGMGHHRFLVPALPFALLLFAKGLDEIRAHLASRVHFREDRLLLELVVAAILAAGAVHGWKVSIRHVRPAALRHADYQENAPVRMAKWLRENAAPDALLLCGQAGALPYGSGLRSIDASGLTDGAVARMLRDRQEGWEERLANALFKARPSYVVLPSDRGDRCEPSVPAWRTLLDSREMREGYAPMSVLGRADETDHWLFTFRRNDLVHDDPPGKIGRRAGP